MSRLGPSISDMIPTFCRVFPFDTWSFFRLKRNADGRFKDEDLANILHDSTSRRAGAFKAKGIPEVLRVIEIMGIQQSRSWGVCSVRLLLQAAGAKSDFISS
jgi:hypothetical protein